MHQPWYKNEHTWALILSDTLSVLAAVSKIVPPQYAAILAMVSHGLYGIDQIVDGATQNNQTPSGTVSSATISTTTKTS